MQTVKIGSRKIGPQHPPYIIAEMSGNHNGNKDRALETIRVAKEMGADAVKLQSYTADALTIDSNKPDFMIDGGLWDGYNLYQLYKEAHTPYEWHKELFDYGAQLGITVFSSPFEEAAIDLLEDLGAPAYKIASFELVDHQLIAYAARTGKPLIMSTGMAVSQEIEEALAVARDNGCAEIILLHCISSYPAPTDQSNVLVVVELAKQFDAVVGLSDHTMTNSAAIASIALGGSVIEKHFTLNREDKGPDSAFSMEPKDLQQLCTMAAETFTALGKPDLRTVAAESLNLTYRRSLYVVEDITAGEQFTAKNMRSIRPGRGLAPKYYSDVLGSIASQNLERGTALQWEHIKS